MPEINPLSNEQIFLKKIAENTGSDYNTGDVSEINPITIDQILLKEIAANTAGQSGDIVELEGKVTANTEAIEATQDMISDAYDSTHTYNVGDYCIYENVLYRCNTAITTPEAFTPAKWDATTVKDELMELTERVNERYVSVTGDGVKTNQQLLNDLYSLVDSTKINKKSRLAFVHDNSTFWTMSVSAITPTRYRFDGVIDQDTTTIALYHVQLSSALVDCIRITNDIQAGGIQSTDLTLEAPSAIYEYRLYY